LRVLSRHDGHQVAVFFQRSFRWPRCTIILDGLERAALSSLMVLNALHYHHRFILDGLERAALSSLMVLNALHYHHRFCTASSLIVLNALHYHPGLKSPIEETDSLHRERESLITDTQPLHILTALHYSPGLKSPRSSSALQPATPTPSPSAPSLPRSLLRPSLSPALPP
jgi:hypothetical protein